MFESLPHPLDPYLLGVERLLNPGPDDPGCLPAWVLAHCVRGWDPGPTSHTTAFAAERVLCERDAFARGALPDILQAIQEQLGSQLSEHFNEPGKLGFMRQVLGPLQRLEAAERTVREQPVGTGILGILCGATGELSLGITWREQAGLYARSSVCKHLGHQLRAHLAELTKPELSDVDPRVGVLTNRSHVWAEIRALLDDPLAKLLVEVPAGTVLSVLAPGFVRPLPWLGLTRAGRPLWEDFVIAQLPHLGFGQSSRGLQGRLEPYTICALGEEREDGETRFGEAAIRTLRACFSIRGAAEPTGPVVENKIVEVDMIERHANAINVLRFYGTTSPYDFGHSTAGIRLRGGRFFRTDNLHGIVLPLCECVELWGATGRMSQYRMVRQADHDRVPGLAWAFLAAGAAGVLDLAWPIHDLVKALVCERFGLIRRTEPQAGSIALARSVREIDALLRQWDEATAATGSVQSALDWLDQARLRDLVTRKLDSRHLVRFGAHADAPSVAFASAGPLIACCRRPEQLATFRWWGSPWPGLL
jgi:hypothetical protein